MFVVSSTTSSDGDPRGPLQANSLAARPNVRRDNQVKAAAAVFGVFLVVATGRVCRWFPIRRNHFVPGRHVTDHHMRLCIKFRQIHSTSVAAAKASIKTAYRVDKDPRLPSHKRELRGRRRADPPAGIFDTEIVALLKSARGHSGP